MSVKRLILPTEAGFAC